MMTKRVFAVILVAAVLAAPLAGETISGDIGVSARVVGRTLLTVSGHPGSVTITAEDVRRGYVDLPRAVDLKIRSNMREGYLLTFDALPKPFARAHVRWQAVHVVVGAAHEAWVAQPYVKGTQAVQADVRLEVAPGTQPGTYAWPISIRVSS